MSAPYDSDREAEDRELFAHPAPEQVAEAQDAAVGGLLERLEADRDAWKQRGDNHWESLRSIREFAREGDCARIIAWVNDAGTGHVESVDATLGQMMDRTRDAEARAERAEAERDALREALTNVTMWLRHTEEVYGEFKGGPAQALVDADAALAMQETGQ